MKNDSGLTLNEESILKKVKKENIKKYQKHVKNITNINERENIAKQVAVFSKNEKAIRLKLIITLLSLGVVILITTALSTLGVLLLLSNPNATLFGLVLIPFAYVYIKIYINMVKEPTQKQVDEANEIQKQKPAFL